MRRGFAATLDRFLRRSPARDGVCTNRSLLQNNPSPSLGFAWLLRFSPGCRCNYTSGWGHCREWVPDETSVEKPGGFFNELARTYPGVVLKNYPGFSTSTKGGGTAVNQA